jgi:F420-dependent oxidoreductase-like protein
VPLLRGEAVDFDGEIHHAHGQVSVPGAEPPSVLVAALGPVMLRTAGELADGTIVTWTGVRTVSEHVVPRIAAAASAAGRAAPRVVLSLPIAVTDDPDGARRWIADRLGLAGDLPSYRAMLDIEGVSGPEDVVIVGDETAVERQLRQFEDAGATELVAVPFGSADQVARTLTVLADLDTVAAAAS